MKRFIVVFSLICIGFTVLAEDAFARRQDRIDRRQSRRGYSTNYYVSNTNNVSIPAINDDGTLYTWVQNGEEKSATMHEIAQMRADDMARLQSMDHGIHHYTGATAPRWPSNVNEGIGCGGSANCATCVCGNTCVADKHAVGKNGMIYRVRFWVNR